MGESSTSTASLTQVSCYLTALRVPGLQLLLLTNTSQLLPDSIQGTRTAVTVAYQRKSAVT